MFTTLVLIQTVQCAVMVANDSQQSQYFQRAIWSEAAYSSEIGIFYYYYETFGCIIREENQRK